jgi:hypothetical protein
MNQDLTEEEMRQALFGNAEVSAPVIQPVLKEIVPGHRDRTAGKANCEKEGDESVHAQA